MSRVRVMGRLRCAAFVAVFVVPALAGAEGGESAAAPADDAAAGGEPPRPEPETPVEATAAPETEPVIVTATRTEAELLSVPAAVSVVEREAFRERAGLALDEGLGAVPGVWTQNRYNFAQGLRLSVRGFGARAPFGIRGLQVYVDGVPATTPDGQTQLDAWDPGFVSRVEVIRGPASALYGNASGGVLLVTTLEPPDETTLGGEILGGSHALSVQRVHGGATHGPWRGIATISNVQLDGHRAHSDAVMRRAGMKAQRVGGRYVFTLQANVFDAPRSRDAGGLTLDAFEDDPRQANGFNVRMDTGDAVAQQMAAATVVVEPRAGEVWEARTFAIRRDFEQRIPVPPASGAGWIAFERFFGGAGVRHGRLTGYAGVPGRLTAGIDLGWQRDDRRRWENAFGTRGAQRQDQIEDGRAAGLYVQQELGVGASGWITLGGRLDQLRLAVDDRFDDPAGVDYSGSRSFTEPSFLAGATWALHPSHAVYVNAASAFESPTFVELRSPDPDVRGFDPDLGAQDALSGEVGMRGVLPGGAGRYDVGVFLARVRGELIAFEEGGIDYYRNAGRTRRAGVEAAVVLSPWRRLELTAAGTVGEFVFRDYRDRDGVQYRGNFIPGIPRSHGFIEAAWRGDGWRVATDLRAAEGVWIDDANEERSPAIFDVGLRAGRSVRVGGVEGRAFAAVSNLLDRRWAANVRINPAGGNPYEPAPGRTLMLGVSVGMPTQR